MVAMEAGSQGRGGGGHLHRRGGEGADGHRAAGYAAGSGPGCADGGAVCLAFALGGVSGVASGGVGGGGRACCSWAGCGFRV